MHSLPIFVINLDRSPERLTSMQAQARALGLRFERVPAVDGTRALPAWARVQFLNELGEPHGELSQGEVGCYASHLLVMSKIIGRHQAAAIVLEDDAVLHERLMDNAEQAVRTAPEGWDCIHLSTNFKRPAFPIADLGRGRSLVRYLRQPINSTAYIISLAGAIKLAAPRRRTCPFDVEFRQPWRSGLELLGTYPALARPHPHFASTIEADWKAPRSKAREQRTTRQQAMWKPSLTSQIRGWFYVLTRLGAAGALHCWTATLGKTSGMPTRDAPHSLPWLLKGKS